MESLQKTVLVTGANKGVGFEISRQLGQLGFRIILSGRDDTRVRKAVDALTHDRISAIPLVMNVSNVTSIREAFDLIKKSIDRIDVLINNAAILIDENKPLLDFNSDEVHQTFSTNALGPFFVSQIFLPLIPRGGRIINISSSAGSICGGVGHYAPLYSASKTSENALVLHLANALKRKGIAVNLVCPGWVRTDMGGSTATRTVEKGAETPVWLATEASGDLTGKFFRDKKEIPL